MIKINKPLSFTEIGLKDNQEDYLYPANAGEDTHVFILCDGMGGHDNGEVASETAATVLGEYLSIVPNIDVPTFKAGLSKAYDALDAIDTHSSKTPGTTLACLCLNEESCLVAHIGDSRIYHIRPSLFDSTAGRGGIIYQSSDHSLVNDLLKAGELTEEEARDFPQKNIITRAMQPHLTRRYEADIFEFNDIREGDYFFLCCDGVLEQLSNERLCEILASPGLSDRQKIEAIKAVCDGKTRDNYTCWLVPIAMTDIMQRATNPQTIQAELEVEVVEPQPLPEKATKRRTFLSIKKLELLLDVIIFILLLSIGANFITAKFFKSPTSATPVLENYEIIKTSVTPIEEPSNEEDEKEESLISEYSGDNEIKAENQEEREPE